MKRLAAMDTGRRSEWTANKAAPTLVGVDAVKSARARLRSRTVALDCNMGRAATPWTTTTPGTSPQSEKTGSSTLATWDSSTRTPDMQDLPDWAEPQVRPHNNGQGNSPSCEQNPNPCRCREDCNGSPPNKVPVDGTGFQIVLLLAGIVLALSKLTNWHDTAKG